MDSIEDELTSWVGKRVIHNEANNLKDMHWHSGIIRCTSSRNYSATDFLICVEWDDKTWEQREWVHVHDVPMLFAEKHLTMLSHPFTKSLSPALVFHPCKANLFNPHHILVEFFADRLKTFVKEEDVRIVEPLDEVLTQSEDKALKEWVCMQKTRDIFLKGSTCLAGCRVLVYGISSALPWINAVITKQLGDRQIHVMTEQVLTQTTVDPLTTQVLFLDANVIDTGGQGRRTRRLARSSGQETSTAGKRRSVITQNEIAYDKVAARGQSSELSPISGKSLQVKCEKQSNEAIASKVRHDGVTGKSMMSSISEPQTASSQQQPIRHHPCSTPNSKLSSSVVLPSSSSVGLTSQCSGAKRPEKMQQSPQQALSNLIAQQALLHETQKHQNQTPQQRPASQPPRIPPQLLAQTYPNPFAAGVQLLYNNQAAAFAQAHLQAAALAHNSSIVSPWLKQAQQGALDKVLQQQALYAAALYGAKALDGLPGYSALLRPDAQLGGNQSPAPRSTSPRREKSNPNLLNSEQTARELMAKKASSSPRLPVDSPAGLRAFHQPRGDLAKSAQSSVEHGMDQAELRRWDAERKRISDAEREKEESWRAKYLKAEVGAAEAARNSKDLEDKKWEPHLSHNITRTPLGMIDPATLFAAHGAQQFIRDDAVRQNGVQEKATSVDPQVSRPSFSTSSPSVAHSYKTWQPPVQMTDAEAGNSPKAPSPAISKTYSGHMWSRPLPAPPSTSGAQVKPLNSSVFNIHALKYRPTTPTSKRSTSPKSEKVIVKTSPISGGKESVKYISDKSPLIHRLPQRSPSPERLGPIMEDGSRARILPPESLKSLYRFPEPSSKTRTTKSGTDSVIIKTGQYKVTEVHGGRESAPSVQAPSSADHLVYPKHPPQSLAEQSHPVPPNVVNPATLASEKGARKRGMEETWEGGTKKPRSDSPQRDALRNLCDVASSSPQRDALRNLCDVASSSDPHLRGLAGAGIFAISGSNIVWGDSSKIGSEYPGAPTKVAIKDALLGLKNENGVNLSINKPFTKETSLEQPPVPSSSEPLSLVAPTHPKKRALLETTEISANSVNKFEAKNPAPQVQDVATDMSTSKPSAVEIKELPSVSVASTREIRPLSPEIPQSTSAVTKTTARLSPDDVTSKAALCGLKKAWIKRSYESGDKIKTSTPLSSDNSASVAESSSPNNEQTESDSPTESLKKVKKKHKLDKEKKNKDATKKKRKHKEGRKVKKENGERQSSSKLFIQGKLVEEREDISEAEDREKQDASKMPLGENGLPVSLLLCRKEQARLKKSGEAFVQDAACHEIAGMSGVSIQAGGPGGSSLPKCRECRSAKRKENSTIFCRFYGFRKLTFVNGHLQAAGFSDPEDGRVSDLSLWLPRREGDAVMELDTCRYIMKHILGKFCELVQDEREALVEARKAGGVRWKRPVHGVREMCDACETTLFNLHWVCQRCGFGICLDCYRTRAGMNKEDMEAYDSDKNNSYRWLKCGKGKSHLPSDLVPTQIIPSSCLFDLSELAHEVRAKWNITSHCRCKKNAPAASTLLPARANDPTPLLKNHCNSELLSQNGGKLPPAGKTPDLKHSLNRDSHRLKGFDCENSASPLDWLASIALREQRKSSTSTAPSTNKNSSGDEKGAKLTEKLQGKGAGPGAAPRSWLCNGQLLQLTDSSSSVNVDTFQLHWFYGMPVMASGASNNLNRELWRPERFSAEHGHQPTGAALINCRKGSIITNALIRDFWNGFEKIENRLCDERTGQKLILKLKDWPTADDFIDTMPEKFDDLMRALPLPQYTARDGRFNMAAHLPDYFVRPDLGPKMYIAYGWVTEKDWSQGTTNLHLDISDACNLMVYVGIPEDEPPEAQETLISIIKEGDADDAQVERAKTMKPGALWHIFKAADTDKIRKLILKVKAEKGIEVSDDHDPIHDQQIYLDKALRRRLREEYGVEGYPLVQCEGDSVFIPAGAPHQVFNLHSCIKVAEDFVSPEHVDKCFKLTEEFRHLSTTHSNHEDKLQLKNIIYHTMKEVVGSFSKHETDPEILGSKPTTAAQT